ncbi:MAG: methyltransferase domain-containing protein [Verrucomicrobiota bacterium]|nr:methyltransferase domain-containing protein [Verrucomicrobiota bacterium]
MNARAVALTALREWRRGRQFADAIIQGLLAESPLQGSDRGFATELFYGALRNLSLLDFWIDLLRSGPLDHASRDLLRLGFYQIFLLETPQHAAVFETVELSGRRNRGLINGVLRTALRRQDELRVAAESAPPAIRFSHPEFLIERWRNNFGAGNTTLLCQWNNQPAPIYARVNRLRVASSEKFLRLDEISTDAIARGEYYIQDPSTAVACELLDPQPNETILDACAAPGGKSVYIAELMANSGTLVACDRDPPRLNLLKENLERLGVANATVVKQDWKDSSIELELRDRKFDRILVDAPCTNTGVMRRRVDVRWRLRPDDFARMPEQQLFILRAVLPFLKSSGTLVYSTCSIEAEENEQVVRRLLDKFPNLHLDETRSILPWRDHLDGAFAAKFLHS